MRRAALALALAVAACGRSRAPAARPDARPAPQAQASATPATDRTGQLAAEARTLLTTWAAARAFPDVAALYGEGFTATVREGATVVTLDRARFLERAATTFAAAGEREVSEVVVAPARGAAVVRFTYRDGRGDAERLRWVVARERGALRILAEERARTVAEEALGLALGAPAFFALPGENAAIAFVAAAGGQQARGQVVSLGVDDPFVAFRPYATEPAELAGWIGRNVTVVERTRTCPGRVRRAGLARVATLPVSVLDAWEARGPDAGPAPASPGERANDAWSLADGTFHVLLVESACDAPVAVSASETVEVQVPRVPTDVERRALHAAFSRTARFAAREQAYATFASAPGHADREPVPRQRARWEAEASVVVFEAGTRRSAVVVHNAEGCGGFDVGAFAPFTLGARPVEVREAAPLGDRVSIMGVFDVGGDGTLEAVFRRDVGGYGVATLTPTSRAFRTLDFTFLASRC